MFTTSLPDLLHSPCALLSCYRWRINKDSNIKAQRQTCSHCINFRKWL